MSEIIPYKEQKLEQLSGKELITPEFLMEEPSRFFLAGNVYVGKYNQAGFVIVDTEPGRRPYWIGSDLMSGYSPKEVEEEIKLGVIPEEKKYFYDTTNGMAALRYFAISNSLMNLLEKDPFFTEPMIRKICEDGVLPDDFDEECVLKAGRDPLSEYLDYDKESSNGLSLLVDQLLSPLNERTGSSYAQWTYVMYFPTAAYPVIVPTLETSVQEVVSRFDKFGDKFNIAEDHKDLSVNTQLIK